MTAHAPRNGARQQDATAPPERQRLVAIVGPTAVGKTDVSLVLARRFGGEIVSGDSMQVYRGMDIGTAKVDPAIRAEIPHHLIDILDPDEPFSVAQFQALAVPLIADINRRGRLPILVGGTGLYVRAVVQGYRFASAPADPALREKWRRFAETHGNEALHAKLREIDPETAARLHPNDVRRIIRALEIYEQTGRTMAEFQRDKERPSPYDLLLIGLTMDRRVLYARINERVDRMIAAGLVDEVRRLVARGFDERATAMQGLGYKELLPYLRGEISLDEAVEAIKRRTRQFAKRQLTWFRHMPGIVWFDMTDPAARAEQIEQICRLVAGKFFARAE